MAKIFQKRLKDRLRKEWKEPNRWDRDFDSIRSLFTCTSSPDERNIVDEMTWNDLDMNSVFRQIDATQTSIGQQYLYRKMRKLQQPGGKLEDDYRIVSQLRNDQIFREKLQICLDTVKEGDASLVTKMLFEGFPIANISRTAVVLWSILSLVTLVFSAFNGGFYIILILIVLILNFSISRHFENSTDKITYVFYHLYNIVATSGTIAKLQDPYAIPECYELSKNISSIRRVRNLLKLLSISQHHENLIINNTMYLLNLVILYDLIVYSFTITKILQHHEFMKKCYIAVGAIDANIAIASYTNRHTNICNPSLDCTHEINVDEIYHPLIENHVSNSFKSKGSSALITGSNMAGKTTFIKTIGVNLILARTLWFCHAAQAQLPVMDIMSSIKTEDGLEEGKSFYFAELERLNTFLGIQENGGNCLFLIDEIYRGTNTVERIAGAVAVLQELAHNSFVFVTTHDIELAEYLNNQYDMWYFEQTGNKAQPFDYLLRSGVCQTRNALKLMSNMGYPEQVTNYAVELAHKIDTKTIRGR